MIKISIILIVLIVIDFLLLLKFSKVYFKIGIPIYRKTIRMESGNKNININSLYQLIAVSDYYKCRINQNTILFRTKFNYFNLYTPLVASIVKGDISIDDTKIRIIQRINLSSVYAIVYLVLFSINIKHSSNGDNNGVTFVMYIFMAIVIYLYYKRFKELDEIKEEIQRELQQDKSGKR